jgi:S-formylglutathione hydrolase FrmB
MSTRQFGKRLLALLLVLCALAIQAFTAVRSEVATHQSTVLNTTKDFYLFYPNKYNPDKTYPVLYLLHGAGGSYRSWSSQGVLAQSLEEFEMFVVLPDGDKFSWYLDSPLSGSKYETYLIEELIPFVDRNYPTKANCKARAISGLSMGGHGAVTLAIKHPDLFGSASSLSGILDIVRHPNDWQLDQRLGKQEENMALWEANSALFLSPKLKNLELALFISCGLDDFALKENRDFHRKLQELRIPHLYVEHPGAHNLDYWLGNLGEHLLFHNYIFTE